MVAAQGGHEKIIRLLLESNVDKHAQKGGKTALDLATSEDIKSMLMDHNEETEEKTEESGANNNNNNS